LEEISQVIYEYEVISMTKKKKRRSHSLTIPLAPIIGVISAPAVGNTIKAAMRGDVDAAIRSAKGFVGIWGDGSFHAETLIANLTPVVIGLLVHKFVGGAPLNLNRTLARANVPFIRI